MKGLDVFGEIRAVFEVELLLPALFGGTGCCKPLRRGIAEDGGAELLVNQNAGFLLGHTSRQGRLKGVIDDLLGRSNLCRLLWAQRAGPAEHLRLEGSAVIEGQEVEGSSISSSGHPFSLSFR